MYNKSGDNGNISQEKRIHSRYFNRGDLIEEIGYTCDGRIESQTVVLHITTKKYQSYYYEKVYKKPKIKTNIRMVKLTKDEQQQGALSALDYKKKRSQDSQSSEAWAAHWNMEP